ncbi:MAG: hypothetical protein L3J74_01370 [Bacteroidales bacterium]|nr:hypothetical protein [Bacteroidales bacterium]
MKNYVNLLIFILFLSFSMTTYASEKPIDKHKTEITNTNKTEAVNVVPVLLPTKKIELVSTTNVEEKPVEIQVYGILCRMEVRGVTKDGMKYHIKGSCKKVLKALEQIK